MRGLSRITLIYTLSIEVMQAGQLAYLFSRFVSHIPENSSETIDKC
jgi:hypothetical protein